MERFRDYIERMNESTLQQTITWLVGPPASGKSTWVDKNAKGAFIISRDDIVDELRKGTNASYADTFSDSVFQSKVNRSLDARISRGISGKSDVVVDMTNMTVKSRAKIMKLVPLHWEKVAVVFQTPRSEIIRRLKRREEETGKRVGLDIVDRMMCSYEEPTEKEGFDRIEFIR